MFNNKRENLLLSRTTKYLLEVNSLIRNHNYFQTLEHLEIR